MSELWRPIDGYDGLYEVSDLGRVRSLDRIIETSKGLRKYRGRVLRQSQSAKYLTVTINYLGRATTHYVHKLVADAFLPPSSSSSSSSSSDGVWVLHGPNGALDCSVSNLYYGTPTQNMLDKRRDGTDHNARKTHCPRRHPLCGRNLVRALLPNRACLSCQRAKSKARYYGRQNDEAYVQDLSDQYFAALT